MSSVTKSGTEMAGPHDTTINAAAAAASSAG